jgi:hypothetical protein
LHLLFWLSSRPTHLRSPTKSVISTEANGTIVWRSGEIPAFAFAVALAFALAFLSVIPSGNLLSHLLFWLSSRRDLLLLLLLPRR